MEMKILVLNGSPHPQGSTKDMVNAFKKGAESAGHIVDVVDVCKKKIGGCLACEYCHSKENNKGKLTCGKSSVFKGLRRI
jgi:multimeric flavodoxin WrbA